MTNDIIIHTKPNEKIVVYFATRNLYDICPAAYNSLLMHNPDVHAFLMIEDDTFPLVHPSNVTIVNISNQQFFTKDGVNFRNAYTYMVLMKAAVSKIFPDAERAVLLDIDTIVHDDISFLWKFDMTDAYYAASTEIGMTKEKGYYYSNFGVVVLNLDHLRNTGMDDKIINALNTKYYPYNEQDAFNELCGLDFIELPNDYNDNSKVCNLTGTPQHSIISHFACLKSWCHLPETQQAVLSSVSEPRIVVYSGNRNYYSNMVNAAKSLLFHSPVDKIYFLIEDNNFPYPLPPIIECINVSKHTVFPLDGPNINWYYSYMTTVRAGLTKLLPNDIARVLWLDSDTIVVDDISTIWNYNLSGYYYAGVEDIFTGNLVINPYYNAGVMLMNLDLFRSTGMDEKVINEINTVKYQHLEQDALNVLCAGKILPLPSTYNSAFISEKCYFPKIKHYLDRAKGDLPSAQEPFAKMEWANIPNAWNGNEQNEKEGD